jgi:chemotaxis protein methyltransferase CheR
MSFVESAPAISDRELAAVIRLVYEKSGITLHDGKRALVVARLQRRLRAGGFESFTAYLRFVESDPSGAELVALLDAIATNHTSFMREPEHFAFLQQHVIVPWLSRASRAPLQIWSAACATGEEPYTIAMTIADTAPDFANAAHVRVLASDLSSRALARGRSAVYAADRVQGLPIEVLRKHFEKGLGAQDGLVRIAPVLRRLVTFEQRNLLEIADLGRRFDAVFCRNVMIYFDKTVQQRVVSMLERHVAPGGFLFISHSESLNGIAHGLTWVAPAV